MICEMCREAGETSIVRVLGTKETLIPKDHYWDEEGQEHLHNPNIVTTKFRCSNGHQITEISSWECFCGYKACEAKTTYLRPGLQKPAGVAP